MIDTFPRSNLPDDSVAWGRALENEIRQTSYGIEEMNYSFRGDNRASAGQMGVTGRQINEIRSRVTQTKDLGEITAAVSLPANYGVGSRIYSERVTLPPTYDGARRSSILIFNAIAYNSDSNSLGTVYVRVNGVVSKPMAAPSMTSTPPGYVETLSICTVLPGWSSFDLELLLIGANNSDTARNIQLGLRDARIVTVYGDEASE